VKVFTYKDGLVDDGQGGLRPDLPPGTAFSSISDGGETLIVKTLAEVSGLTPLNRAASEAEVAAMGFEPKVLDKCGLGGEM
jgi:hypothetical protein